MNSNFWQQFWNSNNRISKQRTKISTAGEAETSIKLGVTGIIFCLISIALTWGVAWLTAKLWIWALGGIYGFLLGNLLLIISGIMLPFFFIQSIVAPCLMYPIHQLILNRKPIGWISLIVGIATIIVCAIGIFIIPIDIWGIINIF